MSSPKRTVLIVAVLGVALLMAGCTSALSGDDNSKDVETDGMSAAEIQTNAVEASQSVESATFTQELTMDVDSQGTIEMDTEGALDMNAEKMRMEGTMEMPQGTFDLTQYVIGDQMYVQTNGAWQQQAAQQNVWDQGQYRQQQEALQSASEVEVVDKTTTSGEEVYVMDVDVDEDELLDIIEQQSAQEGMGQMYEQMEIGDVDVTQHIDTESYQIRHMEMEMDVSMMGEEMTMTMTQTYDDINDPVDITLPEEAEQAPEAGTAY